jgi:hypothetical protein
MLSRQLVAAAELEDSGENIRSGYVSILFHLFLRDSSIGSTCVSVPTQWQYLILPSLLVSIPAPRTASDLSETHEELMGFSSVGSIVLSSQRFSSCPLVHFDKVH